jgi:hypothetical protein
MQCHHGREVKARDLKSRGATLVGSNPTDGAIFYFFVIPLELFLFLTIIQPKVSLDMQRCRDLDAGTFNSIFANL